MNAKSCVEFVLQAMNNVDDEYLNVEIAVDYVGHKEIKRRERVYAYELYHQMRLIQEQKFKSEFTINGEIDKSGHKIIKEPFNPDFVIHQQGKIRAAAYLRLSIEDGDKAESNSIGNQRELIRDFAAERPGLHLVEEYADDGYTGTNFERPGFKRMMEDIKSGKINCIIVKDLSRLGRNYIEMGKYLEQIFPMMGIRFIAINDNYDNANTESSDSDSIVVPFKNLLNDSYCRDISIKVRSQLDMKRRKGEFIGGYAIYGYCKDERNKNRLVVDEYAADIVRSIYRRKLEGMSAQAIAEQLNSENVLAPSEYKRLCGLNYHSG